MRYAETPPPAALADIVRCLWQLQGPSPQPLLSSGDPALPDGSPELIINLGDPFEYLTPDGTVRRQPTAFLVGQITRPFVVRPTGQIDLFALRFEAHGAGAFHQPMSALTDTWSALSQLGGPSLDPLVRLLRDTLPDHRADVACEFIQRARSLGRAIDPRVAHAVREIRQSGGAVALDALTFELGVSSRTLQRLFATHVGLTPKLLAQVVRFQRVFGTARDNPRALARVAQQCGYYDQAHLIRDFRRFAGEAPTRVLTALPQFTAFFMETAAPSPV